MWRLLLRRALLLLLVPACNRLLDVHEFPPVDGGDDATASDGRARDAPLVDAQSCYGVAPDLGSYCFMAPPTGALTLAGTIDTAMCTGGVLRAGTCLFAANDVIVDDVRVKGITPLVVIAVDTLTVDGTLDASTAGSSVACAPLPADATGGGAGGGYATLGGRGGNGTGAPGSSSLPVRPLSALAGGCAGGSVKQGPPGGGAGGAVYLIAGSKLQLTSKGAIFANGGGGGGGISMSGGGGGGSGGLIALDAPEILASVDTLLLADGGGGGGGAGSSAGIAGTTPTSTMPAAGGGPGTGPFGTAGTGGKGGADAAAGSSGTQPANPGLGSYGGGGGGGGVGYIVAYVDAIAIGATTSPPVAIKPR